MQPLKLRSLKGKPKVDSAAGSEIDKILSITTQLPPAATVDSGGTAELTVNGLRVRILRDTTGGATNVTRFKPIPSQFNTPGGRTQNGVVTRIMGAIPTPPTIEIQTSYAATGPQAGLDPVTAPSAYGRGTTATDRAAGNTSLRFHESRHGEDYLSFLKARPFPTFTGAVGMTERAFKSAGVAYTRAVKDWIAAMGQASLCATDCAGTPDIDQFEGNTGTHLKCTTCAGP